MGISDTHGVIHTHIIEGSVTAKVFEHFLQNLHMKLLPISYSQKRKTTIICDNASIH
jgi:hypothetical protein